MICIGVGWAIVDGTANPIPIHIVFVILRAIVAKVAGIVVVGVGLFRIRDERAVVVFVADAVAVEIGGRVDQYDEHALREVGVCEGNAVGPGPFCLEGGTVRAVSVIKKRTK